MPRRGFHSLSEQDYMEVYDEQDYKSMVVKHLCQYRLHGYNLCSS